jgi:hypothetical protein
MLACGLVLPQALGRVFLHQQEAAALFNEGSDSHARAGS